MNMDKLIWPITLVVCIVAGGLTAPGIIRAVKEPPVIVQPGPAPVVVNTFADDVAAAWKANDGNSEDACIFVEGFTSLSGLLTNDTALTSTEQLDKITRLGNKLALGKEKPFGGKYQWFQDMMAAELIKRGVTPDADKNGKPETGAIDRAGWLQFYSDVVKGLSQ